MIDHSHILHYLRFRGKDSLGNQSIKQAGTLKHRYNGAAALLVFLFLFFVGLPSLAGDDMRPRILMLFSYNSNFPSYNDQIAGLESVLPGENYRIDIEFLDSKRFPEGPVRDKINSALVEKMKFDGGTRYDCIITADDNALHFVLEQQRRGCPEIPIFFFGVNNRELAYAQDDNPKVTGVVEDISLEENLTLIRTIFPDSILKVVTDGTRSGRGDLETLRELAAVSGDYRYLDIMDLSTLSWEELASGLADDSGSPVFLISAYFDRTGAMKSFEEGLNLILEAASGPVFHLWTHGMGEGIAGGILVSQFEQARKAALMAEEYFNSPEAALPSVLRESPNLPIFDYKVFRRWKISIAYLPPYSRIINRPLAFLNKYRHYVVFLAVLVIFFLLVIFLLVYLLHRTRAAESSAGSSTRKWQRYLDLSPLGILVTDKEGRILEASPAAGDLLGLEQTELRGMNGDELFAGRYGDPGGMIIVDYDHPGAGHKSLSLERSDIEENERLIILRDITEHQRYQQEKELRQRELQAVIDLMPTMIFMKDREGNFLMVNKACADSMGRPVKEILGRNHRELHTIPDQLEMMLEEDRKVIESGEALTVWDEKLTLPGGGDVRLDVVKLPFQSYDNGETVVLGMAQNVTEKYSLQEGVKRTERLRSIGLLAGGVAHDFNNQLMGILGYLELATGEDLPEKVIPYLEGIRTAAKRSAELVQNLLGFSREKPKNLIPADVHAILNEVVSLVQASRRRGIVYRSDFNSVHSVIPCDTGMVENTFFHVVLNAVQAIRSEGEVRITTSDVSYEDLPPEELGDDVPVGPFVLIRVDDNGEGMDEDVRAKAFEPFFTTKMEEGGSGMGLALVYGTVKNHHGIVQIESKKDEGTTVMIYLPVRS